MRTDVFGIYGGRTTAAAVPTDTGDMGLDYLDADDDADTGLF
jgi:hypothetical protein